MSLWAVLGCAAWEVARSRDLPARVAVPLALALFTELPFYLLPGFHDALEYLRRSWKPAWIAAALTAAGLLPYLTLAIPTDAFSWSRCGVLLLLLGTLACWFLLPRSIVRNLLFLIAVAAANLSGLIPWIYPGVQRKAPGYIAGNLTLIHTAVLAVLLLDSEEPVPFGFLPTVRELAIGTWWGCIAMAVGFPFGVLLGQIQRGASGASFWSAVGLVFAIFWVVALSEEFFFRALLQRWISNWTHSVVAGLVLASASFGAAHLWFRAFPNVRFALLAAILGLFYGAAYLQARSMRASMVSHTIVVAVWRLFFH